MIPLYELLDKAQILLLTAEEEKVFNSNPRIIAKFKELDKQIENVHDFNKVSIGEFYSRMAIGMWNTDKSGVIKGITDFIENDEFFSETFLIGYMAAWANSDIQHPIIENLIKHILKNDLLKYSLSTTVTEHLSLTNKAPSNRPKKDVIDILDMLMYYFETTTLSGVENSLSVGRKEVRTYLNRLVDGKNQDYKILINKDYKYHGMIEKLYIKWKL